MNCFLKIRIFITALLFVIFILMTAWGCANRGSGPQGGPKDTTPPKLQKSSPENRATNFNKQVVELTFDEIVLVESPFEKVIISPPQSVPPVIKALGHKVRVELKDSLAAETTYTIDFTDAIVDNNEHNKLNGYTFSFSTGDHIDTLKMSGVIIDAETLNPISGIMVGIHSDLHDSAFTSVPFVRITKTDGKGEFTVNNIAEGKYRIYAITDIGNNYLFDLPTEQIAFNDSVYSPSCHETVTMDTIFAFAVDSVSNTIDSTSRYIDSVIVKNSFIFKPDNIILKAFKEKDLRQYLIRTERPQPYMFTMTFANRCDTLPQLTPLNVSDSLFRYKVQRSINSDTLTYWLADTLLWLTDTLSVEARYRKTDFDSVYMQTDTLQIVYRRPKNRKNSQEPASSKLFLSHNGTQKFDVYNDLFITFSLPTDLNDTVRYVLQQKKDTLWTDLDARLLPCDSLGLKYRIAYRWQPQASYRLTADSALFIGIDGSCTHAENIIFTVKSLEEYSRLIFNLKNHTGKEVVQILDKDDKIVRQAPVSNGSVTFEYLSPGIYFARLFVDENGNGLWDTGRYKEHRQAETVYYFPYDIELRAFWDVEEDWDLNELPLLEQKPVELKKVQTQK